MRIFSFDVSSQAIHLCLVEDGKVALEKIFLSKNLNRQELATNLLPAMADSLKLAAWNKSSLDGVVVGRGPGSFTGIRGAVVVARTLAYALKLPLIGITRFEVIASCFSGPIGVVLPAYRDSYYVSVLEVSSSGLSRILIEPRNVEQAELASTLDLIKKTIGVERFVLYTDIGHAAPETSPAQALLDPSSEALLGPMPTINNLAVKQAEIAWNRLSLKAEKSGGCRDSLVSEFAWQLVEPLYLREPSVTVVKG